ncbi:hypothetical protein WICPIJ_001001 [Wickerhamomyces pijperi]|uniref:ferroxidase n=1 Tax=Wickerhamomyces pijperi TaxID=599730 RepID=A0A9P8QBJ0_WICPI|nr:hypothetical protein WICPIJ_001001 [Wickerhamomyces pijperi]
MFRNQLQRIALFSTRSSLLRVTIRSSKIKVTPTLLPTSISQTRQYSVTTQGIPTTSQITELTPNEFHSISGEYLETLFDHLEYLGESNPSIDVEYSQGVLTLDLPPNGTYVINKQPPNKQIWLSSPVSGPDRFDLVEGKWVSLRNGLKLGDVLREEISGVIGEQVPLEGLDD